MSFIKMFDVESLGSLDLSEPTAAATSSLSKNTSDLFKIVNEHYRNDINAVWVRSNYFLLSDLGLLAFYSSVGFDRNNTSLVKQLSSIGIILSFVWLGVVVSSIFWIRVWRRTVVDVEEKMFSMGPYKRGERIGGRRFHEFARPQVFAAALSFIFIVIWFLIFSGFQIAKTGHLSASAGTQQKPTPGAAHPL